jgi:hypothetical protein
MSELHDLDRRLAVLEQIAADIRQALIDIRADIRDLRNEVHDFRNAVHSEMWRNFRWLLGVMLGGFGGMFALLAHGLHWF